MCVILQRQQNYKPYIAPTAVAVDILLKKMLLLLADETIVLENSIRFTY